MRIKRRFKVIEGSRRWTRPTAYGGKTAPASAGWGRYSALWLGAVLIGLWVGIPSDLARTRDGENTALMEEGQVFKEEFGFCHSGGGVNCVVDGDTLYLRGQKIRIAGIDAPETHDFDCPLEQALGNRATGRLQELLNGGSLTLASIERDRDRYGRLLRDVSVDGRDVGDTLIAEGLARPYRGRKEDWC